MKIQSKLVFDKHTNELIGFVDLGEEESKLSSFGSCKLATHALVFFCAGCCHRFKVCLRIFHDQGCYIIPDRGIILEVCVCVRAGVQPMGMCSCL